MNYVVNIDNDVAGKGFGEQISDTDLAGWDVPHLLKIGAILPVSAPSTKKDDK